jgi:hypothetical protein
MVFPISGKKAQREDRKILDVSDSYLVGGERVELPTNGV